MQITSLPISKKQVPLRALVEFIDGELKCYPIADSDEDEARIMDALRFFQGAPVKR